MFSAMSYGSITYNAHAALARAAEELGTYYNTGEGGLHEDFYRYGKNTIVQVASGRFGVHKDYLNAGAAIEIKMGQGAKPGIGGHLPGREDRGRRLPYPHDPRGVGRDLTRAPPRHLFHRGPTPARLFPQGGDRISKAGHRQDRGGPQRRGDRLAASRARGADVIAIDGFRGGTGAAPTRIRDNVGIPIELALAAVDQRLREEGIRGNVSVVVGGSIRSSADIVKAVALGADAVYIATAALLALGCRLCRSCHQGRCNWGIATQRPELVQPPRPGGRGAAAGKPCHRLEARD